MANVQGVSRLSLKVWGDYEKKLDEHQLGSMRSWNVLGLGLT